MLGDCPPAGYVIASGVLESAEPIDGTYYHVNALVLMVHPDGVPARIVQNMSGKAVEVILREIPLRPELQRLNR
jgi:hypothetical protein